MRESVRWFAEKMEAALAAHDDRPGWEGESTRWLFMRLCDEADELETAFRMSDPERMIHEAADVAAFAMMIADNARGGRARNEEF